jgi:hypothetical protein
VGKQVISGITTLKVFTLKKGYRSESSHSSVFVYQPSVLFQNHVTLDLIRLRKVAVSFGIEKCHCNS